MTSMDWWVVSKPCLSGMFIQFLIPISSWFKMWQFFFNYSNTEMVSAFKLAIPGLQANFSPKCEMSDWSWLGNPRMQPPIPGLPWMRGNSYARVGEGGGACWSRRAGHNAAVHGMACHLKKASRVCSNVKIQRSIWTQFSQMKALLKLPPPPFLPD